VYVVEELPRDIELLIGLPEMQHLERKMLLDVVEWRVYNRTPREVIRLDELRSVVERQRARPGKMLALCAGMLTELHVALELGFKVQEVQFVERSSTLQLRQMLQKLHGKRVRCIGLHVERLTPDEVI
jgi:hypothetical protein